MTACIEAGMDLTSLCMIYVFPAWFENGPKSITHAAEARKSDLSYKDVNMVNVTNLVTFD